MDYDEYLRQPCDDKSCDRIATHNQHREDGAKWCNSHTDWTKYARARNG